MDIYRVVMVEERSLTYEVVADNIDNAVEKIHSGVAEVVDTDTLDFDMVDYSVEHRKELFAVSGFADDTPADGVGLW